MTLNKSVSVGNILVFAVIFFTAAGQLCSELTREYKQDSKGNNIHIYKKNNKAVAKEIYDEEWKLLKREGKLPDGLIKEYDSNGKIRAEINVKKGRKNGVFKLYEDGELVMEVNYKNGKREGIMNMLEGGKIVQEAVYKGDKAMDYGKVYDYYDNGNLKGKWRFTGSDKKGYLIPNGTTKTYSESDGNLEADEYFMHGRLIDYDALCVIQDKLEEKRDSAESGKGVKNKYIGIPATFTMTIIGVNRVKGYYVVAGIMGDKHSDKKARRSGRKARKGGGSKLQKKYDETDSKRVLIKLSDSYWDKKYKEKYDGRYGIKDITRGRKLRIVTRYIGMVGKGTKKHLFDFISEKKKEGRVVGQIVGNTPYFKLKKIVSCLDFD